MSFKAIKPLLQEKGYRIGDLTERLWHTKGTNISHSRVAAYIRASDESYGKPEVWEDIKACLSDMGVEWT